MGVWARFNKPLKINERGSRAVTQGQISYIMGGRSSKYLEGQFE